MSFFNKAKQAAEQAAAKAREGVEDVQQKRELSQAYNELGKTAFELLESGEISNSRLEATAGKIRELNAKIAEAPAGAGATASTDDAGDPSQPPAMPT
jgi:outer membrane murein-binding lipoprotein Lpp